MNPGSSDGCGVLKSCELDEEIWILFLISIVPLFPKGKSLTMDGPFCGRNRLGNTLNSDCRQESPLERGIFLSTGPLTGLIDDDSLYSGSSPTPLALDTDSFLLGLGITIEDLDYIYGLFKEERPKIKDLSGMEEYKAIAKYLTNEGYGLFKLTHDNFDVADSITRLREARESGSKERIPVTCYVLVPLYVLLCREKLRVKERAGIRRVGDHIYSWVRDERNWVELFGEIEGGRKLTEEDCETGLFHESFPLKDLVVIAELHARKHQQMQDYAGGARYVDEIIRECDSAKDDPTKMRVIGYMFAANYYARWGQVDESKLRTAVVLLSKLLGKSMNDYYVLMNLSEGQTPYRNSETALRYGIKGSGIYLPEAWMEPFILLVYANPRQVMRAIRLASTDEAYINRLGTLQRVYPEYSKVVELLPLTSRQRANASNPNEFRFTGPLKLYVEPCLQSSCLAPLDLNPSDFKDITKLDFYHGQDFVNSLFVDVRAIKSFKEGNEEPVYVKIQATRAGFGAIAYLGTRSQCEQLGIDESEWSQQNNLYAEIEGVRFVASENHLRQASETGGFGPLFIFQREGDAEPMLVGGWSRESIGGGSINVENLAYVIWVAAFGKEFYTGLLKKSGVDIEKISKEELMIYTNNAMSTLSKWVKCKDGYTWSTKKFREALKLVEDATQERPEKEAKISRIREVAKAAVIRQEREPGILEALSKALKPFDLDTVFTLDEAGLFEEIIKDWQEGGRKNHENYVIKISPYLERIRGISELDKSNILDIESRSHE